MTINTVAAARVDAPPATRKLAEFIVGHPFNGWGDDVGHAAHRTFLNWLGCSIGAAKHATLETALLAIQELDPAPQAMILGRSERVDIGSAALLNGLASHTFDFDDTHLKTIIHPAGPVASAALAWGERTGASGLQLLDALVIGIEVSCRMGEMIYPDHYDRGWHITGSTGMFGAAAAVSRMLRLNADQTTMALGIAASQPVGFREQFGTMTKPLHPGIAARAGLEAALLARRGFTASNRAIEAARGYAQTISAKTDWNKITEGLGHTFEISVNAFKPFACGIVIHPSIDGCIRIRNAYNLRAQDIVEVRLKVHSLVLELTGKKEPRDGLEGKFSVYHSCAVGLIFGKAGQAEYTDPIVNRKDVIELRRKIVAEVDNEITEAAADVIVVCADGRSFHERVEHAVGSVECPMTDGMLNSKFDDLVKPILGSEKTSALRDCVWQMKGERNLLNILHFAQP